MKKIYFLLFYFFVTQGLHAQNSDDLISTLQDINSNVTKNHLITNSECLISKRAMNIFLAIKMSYFLSDYNDLSFYKNNITFNSYDASFSLNHNLFEAKGNDSDIAIKSFMVVGAKANIENAFAASFSNSQFSNELGFTLKQTWLSKTKTFFCNGNKLHDVNQKQNMDAIRAAILYSLENEIKYKTEEFEKSINEIKEADIPGQNSDSAKSMLRNKFENDLKEEYEWKFADLQAESLIQTNNFRLITKSWTSINTYIPLIDQRFIVADSLSGSLMTKHGFPLEFSISHTKFLESPKIGRFFLTVSSNIYLNNSVKSNALNKLTASQYLSMGGKDSSGLNAFNTNQLFTGSFKSFITPLIRGQVIYFPRDSHVGFNITLEKNFGTYKPLNAIFAIPIVLIDKKGIPAANFQFTFNFFDITNQVFPGKKIADKTFISLNVGVPFSKIIF